jgi:hypothetical protein
MRFLLLLSALVACSVASSAVAQDRLDVDGLVDVRWVHATGDLSYLDGGIGVLRFDPDHDGLRLGRAMLATRLRVSDTISVHAVLDAYGDHNGNVADLSELWADVRPFPTGPIRWRARVGAFYAPVSLENRGPGWSDVYTITPSAINTWLGEEFRTIGAEIEGRWLGADSGYGGDLALTAAVYGWNDAAGSLLAERGFAMTDRPAPLFGGLGMPSAGTFHEIDQRPGYYAGLDWHHHGWLDVRALRYDNRADPAASSTEGGTAWSTSYTSAGVRMEPGTRWTLIAQGLSGDTLTSPGPGEGGRFQMTFRGMYALASFEQVHDRLTIRYDHFSEHQAAGGYYGPPSTGNGHGYTLGWTHSLGEHWELAAEWIRLTSTFPPRIEYDLPPGFIESQVQLAVRYRFQLRT